MINMHKPFWKTKYNYRNIYNELHVIFTYYYVINLYDQIMKIFVSQSA